MAFKICKNMQKKIGSVLTRISQIVDKSDNQSILTQRKKMQMHINSSPSNT